MQNQLQLDICENFIVPVPDFILVVSSFTGINNKNNFLRRSHKVALMGGVNGAQMPLLIMIVSLLASKNIFRKLCSVYIIHFGCFRENKTYFSFNSACL